MALLVQRKKTLRNSGTGEKKARSRNVQKRPIKEPKFILASQFSTDKTQNLTSSQCEICSPKQAGLALFYKINIQMSSAKFLPVLPTPTPERACDCKTDCS